MKVVSKFLVVIFILTKTSTFAKNVSFLESGFADNKPESVSVNNTYDEVLSSQNTININKLMRKVQQQYNRNKLQKSHIAQAYFRETGNYNGKYVYFYESRGYSIFMKKPWSAALFSNYKFFPEQSRISDIDPNFTEKMKAINHQDKESNFKDAGFSNNENNYRRFQEYGPLSRKKHQKFQYSLDSVYKDNGLEYYKIAFTKDAFQGFLVVDSRHLNLVKTEYKTDQLISGHHKKYVQGTVKLSFLYKDAVPYLSEMESKSTDHGLTITNYLKILSDNFSGFDVKEEEYWAFTHTSLYANINYNPEKWPNIPYYKGDDFKKIEKDLSQTGKSLKDQFVKNAQQTLNPDPDPSSIALAEEKIQKLKKQFRLTESDTLAKKRDDEELIKHLEEQKKEVERKEKQLLTEDLIEINKAVESGKIIEAEAEEQKKAKALKRAKNINDQQEIIQASINLITRNKENGDSLYYRGLEFIGIRMDRPAHEEKFRKTFGSLVMGAGFSNTRSKETSIGDQFRVAGSRYFEIGYKWSTGLTLDNFLRFNYGFLFQFDGFKPKNHNQYFKIEDDQVVLEDFPDHLKKAKLRTSNFIIPLHFEIGPTDKNGYRKNFKFGVGGFAGLNLSTIQKLKYTEDGRRHKRKNRFNSQAEDLIYGWSGYIGYKNTALLLRYHMNSLFKYNDISDKTITLGIRWSL